VSEANNFPSRAPAQKPKPAPRQARRRRTGRNVQFNIKATPETIARFTALADKNKLVFGELLDRALDAFEQATVEPVRRPTPCADSVRAPVGGPQQFGRLTSRS